MQANDVFNFETFETPYGKVDRIRLKGHRIDIEQVLKHLLGGTSPETISRDIYPTLKIEEVRACLDYYRANQEEMDRYLAEGERVGEAYYQEHLRKPNPLRERILAGGHAPEKNGEA